MKKYFAFLYTPGSAWKEGENWDTQNLMPHGEYMAKLHGEGILVLGGPFDDGTGGQSVIAVDSMEEAKEIAENDPAVIGKVFEVTIKPWLIAFENQKN